MEASRARRQRWHRRQGRLWCGHASVDIEEAVALGGEAQGPCEDEGLAGGVPDGDMLGQEDVGEAFEEEPGEADVHVSVHEAFDRRELRAKT